MTKKEKKRASISIYGNNNDYLYLEVYLYVLSFKRRETILNDAKRVLNDAKRVLNDAKRFDRTLENP